MESISSLIMIVTLSLMYCAETLLNIRSKHRNEVEVSNLKQQIQSLIPFMDICQEFKAKIESGETGSVRVYTVIKIKRAQDIYRNVQNILAARKGATPWLTK